MADGSVLTRLLAPLADLGRAFTPPQLDLTTYDGLEYRWKFFVFLLRQEAILAAAIAVYVIFYWFGSSVNARRANTWLNAHSVLYEAQFARPLDGGLIKDGYTDFFAFSTGRRVVESLHTVFTLIPRHDMVQIVFQFLWRNLYDLAYEPRDELLLDFKISDDVAVPDFVFAIVSKDELHSIKDNRWDLSFTKTSENPALPSALTVMSEFADVTEAVFKQASTFLDTLKKPATQRYFRSLSITDQPRAHPEKPTFARERRVLLSLVAPPPSDAAATLPLVTATFALVDGLERLSLRPETKTKLRKVREEFVARMKEEAAREAKEEAADVRAAAKKKAEEERIAALPAAEQAKARVLPHSSFALRALDAGKILERERKRNLRKTQGKVVRK
ncbi:DUF1682-domain-containing protein [Vararia minispora EC-137]|uniref:DUF1682-domain-containing protein n=1 Tax=Vararia minispora EC-137 TaxID=1314806 RepID=A0ACB8QZ85_9AGAM|nr:DUF1682-domain-containing protein [Vararia minispora EC-137]